jgi:hypothetical protein
MLPPVNESNTPSAMRAQGATPAPSTLATRSDANGRRSRSFANRPLFATPKVPAQPAPIPVIDETLGEHDLQISIAVNVHGRSVTFADFNSTKTIYDGLSDCNRGVFFLGLENLLQDIQRAVAIKVNTKLDDDKRSNRQKGNGNGNGGGNGHYSGVDELHSESLARPSTGSVGAQPLTSNALPSFVEMEGVGLPQPLTIHEPPPLDFH